MFAIGMEVFHDNNTFVAINVGVHLKKLFALFAAGVVVLSGILGYFEVSVVDPRPVGAKGRADNGMIEVVSLMNAEGLRMIVMNLVSNFVGFAPLGTVLVALLGVGVAERSGWLTAVIRAMVLKAPPHMVTIIIVFAGVLSNTASEMGYVVLVPLAAVVFYSAGSVRSADLPSHGSPVPADRLRLNRKTRSCLALPLEPDGSPLHPARSR